MNRNNFPLIALALSLPLMAILFFGGRGDGGRTTGLPLLTLLTVAEFGLVANAIGAGLAVQGWVAGARTRRQVTIAIGCALISLLFLLQLVYWWPL
ncbi:MAG: hypothetical protein EA400_04705 [Chromatiaceae bacterium]|nr:MAG: hypothetical protein EA400_04705 [Chromatiaceae bacterium]